MQFLRLATAFSLTAASLGAQSPTLDAVAAAMGGKERILAVRTLVLEGTGTSLNFGQNATPTAETQFEITSYRRAIDLANKRWYLDQTRVPKFVTANTAPQRLRWAIDGELAFNVNNNGLQNRFGGALVTERQWDFLNHPVAFVQAASVPGAAVTETAEANSMRRLSLAALGGTIAMVVDGRTNLPARIERRVDQAMLGDVTLVTELLEYRDAGGMLLPMRIVQRYENLFTLGDLRLTASRMNTDVGDIAASDSLRALPPVANPVLPPPNVAVDTIAPGVWRIAGGSHHTIAIEQSNRVVLVEAPQSDVRTLAAIAKAREIAPAGKPVNMVVNTHHHFDHSGGFRAAVSEGLTVVTHQGNTDFYERTVYPRPHTINPDALQKNRKPLNLLVVGDRHTMRDGLRTIEIHHMPGNPHNANMLVVYLPAEKILIQADLFNPPAPNAPPPPGFPFAANLVENVQKRGLQVERVVGIHGLPVSWNDIVAAASANR